MKATAITLRKGNFTFAQNGNIQCGIATVGTWHKRDIWAEHGSTRDKSGNRLVHYMYTALLADGSDVIDYSRQQLRNALDGRKVTLPQA